MVLSLNTRTANGLIWYNNIWEWIFNFKEFNRSMKQMVANIYFILYVTFHFQSQPHKKKNAISSCACHFGKLKKYFVRRN